MAEQEKRPANGIQRLEIMSPYPRAQRCWDLLRWAIIQKSARVLSFFPKCRRAQRLSESPVMSFVCMIALPVVVGRRIAIEAAKTAK